MRKLFASDIPKEPELPLHVDSGPEETTEAAEQPGKHVQCKRMKGRHFDKRVKSELALEKELPWHFEPGCSYHCISFGDVDSLTYLRAIVKQQKIEYCYLPGVWLLLMQRKLKTGLKKDISDELIFMWVKFFREVIPVFIPT